MFYLSVSYIQLVGVSCSFSLFPKTTQVFSATFAITRGFFRWRIQRAAQLPPPDSTPHLHKTVESRLVQVYAVIPFNRNGAILGILRIAFKVRSGVWEFFWRWKAWEGGG